MTGYKRVEDAADALEESCGRLDTITLVDAGGTETTVRRGSTVTRPDPFRAGTGPDLDAVAAVLEAYRNDSHRRGVRAHDTSSQILEAQRGVVSGLAALSNEVSQSHRDTRERAERDSTGFALSSRITGHLLYLARNCDRDDVKLGPGAVGNHAFRAIQTASGDNLFEKAGILALISERTVALTLALRIGNRSKPSLELTHTPARDAEEVRRMAPLCATSLREVFAGKGKNQKTAKEMGLCGTDVLALMKAQTTVLAAVLGERHRKRLLAAINFFETKHVQNAIIYSAPWMEGAWKEMFRAFASSIETILRECKANEVTTQDEILAFIIATDLSIPSLGWQDFPAVQKKLETDIESEKQAVLDRLVDRVRREGGAGRLGAGGTDDLLEDTLKARIAEEQRRKDSRRRGAGGDDDDTPEDMRIQTPVKPWNIPSDIEKCYMKRCD